MKLTALFLFIATVTAIYAISEFIKKTVNELEFSQATRHRSLYEWTDISYRVII